MEEEVLETLPWAKSIQDCSAAKVWFSKRFIWFRVQNIEGFCLAQGTICFTQKTVNPEHKVVNPFQMSPEESDQGDLYLNSNLIDI